MSTLRVGFVGAGMMAQSAHIPGFQRAEGCEVVALAEARPRLRQLAADRFGIGKRYESHEELKADPEIDLAAIIVPPECNPPLCIELLEAGKHVFCEKPVSLAAADAQRMADAAAANGRLLLVGFMKRHDAGVQAAKALVDGWLATGEVGAPLFARVHAFLGGDWVANIEGLAPVIKTDDPTGPAPTLSFPEWLPAEQAGMWGPYYFLNHVHSHDMDLLCHFLGSEWSVVHADWSRATKTALLDFNGTAATLEIGKAGTNNRWDEEMTLYFEHAVLHVQLPPPLLINSPARVEVYTMGEKQQVCDLHARYSWSFLRQAQGAVDAALGKCEPLCTIADAVNQMRMTEALFAHVCGHAV